MPWLDKTGVTHLWSKIKTYINSVVPKANYNATSYTSFAGSVVSDGTLTVTKKHHTDCCRQRVGDAAG